MGQTEEDKLLNEVTGKSYEFGFTTDIESDTRDLQPYPRLE